MADTAQVSRPVTKETEDEKVARLLAQGYNVRIEPCPRRLRVHFAGQVVADTTRAVYLFETKHLPVYYLPLADLRQDLLEPSATRTRCPFKGEATYWSLVVGDRRADDALWGYPSPIESCPDISAYAAFYWDRVDAWFEEDEQVFVHPRDPHHRVDVLESSRHVEVVVGGEVVADSHRPRLLFETGLPTRYYLPRLDVRTDLLTPSDTETACPYKGWAGYWSYTGAAERKDDIAWCYRTPIVEQAKIANLICFFNERVDEIRVDGVALERPRTPWSR
jgi:uncharacterized protein (DUF427 family)